MREMLFESKINRFIGDIYFLNLFFYIIFGRPYSGIYLFGFRLGEIILGFFLILNLVILFIPNKYLRTPANYDNLLIYIFKSIILSFFIILLLNGGSLTNLYSYKSSSYIWMLGVIFFSGYFVSFIFNKKTPFILLSFYLV